MVYPCSRILLEELHRQSRNSPYLKKSEVHKCGHKSTNNERNKNNANRNNLESEVTDYARGDRGSYPGGTWIGLSFMSKTFQASNQPMRADPLRVKISRSRRSLHTFSNVKVKNTWSISSTKLIRLGFLFLNPKTAFHLPQS
jgi:hypothetical protein